MNSSKSKSKSFSNESLKKRKKSTKETLKLEQNKDVPKIESSGKINMNKKLAATTQRLDRIEQYLQDRFNWNNIKTPKKEKIAEVKKVTPPK